MKSIKTAAVAALTAGILSGSIFAEDTAMQSVTFTVTAINELAVSDEAVSLTINTAKAGEAPTPATKTSSYAITTNETGRKITAALSGPMPDGVTLEAELAAPTGAISAGNVTLDHTKATDVVTNISTLNESGKTITYTLSATSAAGVVTTDNTRTVTYTITAGE